MPISPAARWIISSASISRRCCGASCRARESAGRVQSVALRLVCDRELEIEKFVAREYWSLVAHLRTQATRPSSPGSSAPTARRSPRLDIGTGAEAEDFKAALENAAFTVTNRSRPSRPSATPTAPFTTSTLQQEASRKLGMAPGIAMRIAQKLYEGVDIGGETVGLITYMRTDGVDVAPEAITAARSVIGKEFGERLCAGRAAQISGQGQERAGSA